MGEAIGTPQLEGRILESVVGVIPASEMPRSREAMYSDSFESRMTEKVNAGVKAADRLDNLKPDESLTTKELQDLCVGAMWKLSGDYLKWLKTADSADKDRIDRKIKFTNGLVKALALIPWDGEAEKNVEELMTNLNVQFSEKNYGGKYRKVNNSSWEDQDVSGLMGEVVGVKAMLAAFEYGIQAMVPFNEEHGLKLVGGRVDKGGIDATSMLEARHDDGTVGVHVLGIQDKTCNLKRLYRSSLGGYFYYNGVILMDVNRRGSMVVVSDKTGERQVIVKPENDQEGGENTFMELTDKDERYVARMKATMEELFGKLKDDDRCCLSVLGMLVVSDGAFNWKQWMRQVNNEQWKQAMAGGISAMLDEMWTAKQAIKSQTQN
ncbi:hypothetical protein A2368_00230 [Candidatus Collierbacteria bacterium RIFOXYB1_FULL_49_13]|uniref:Uncharacterized protein n=1 Tax=Candidatus Collierbacteria bacterium RIFOXYB1_FULL_49_13 TaxID=1817728 RepID=A0A1F5FF66_9BACT|nr:MAG: hypothetical protein A2368_00230 [Candidatus Collierbacteria bacterium RIFOXYB1_FULL_49_13]